MRFCQTVSGDAEIIKWMDDPQNLVHFAQELSFEGFRLEMLGSRFPYLLRGGKAGDHIWFPVRGGEFYLSFQFLCESRSNETGETGAWRFAVELDGERLGEINMDTFDGRYYLFCSRELIQFMGHRRVWLRVLEGSDITVSCAVFSKTPVFPPANQIEYLTAKDGKIRFNTTVPSVCRLEYGDQVMEEDDYFNCHWFDVEPVSGELFTVCAKEKDGRITKETGVVTVEEKKHPYQEKSLCTELLYEARSREKTPVSGFFVFEKGDCFQLKQAGVCDVSGQCLPSDCRITSYWEDGSIKSVAITSVLVPDGRSYYFCSHANGKAVEQADRGTFGVFRQGRTWRITNEGQELTFAEDDDFLLPGLGSKTILYVEGMRFEPQLECWEIKHIGNASLVLERKGRFTGIAKEEVLYLQVTIYRGIPGFCVEIGLENNQTTPRLFALDGWYLELEGACGLNENKYQIDDRWAEVGGELTKARCQGNARLTNYQVHVRDFWQNYPKSMECEAGRLSIGLMPLIRHRDIYDQYTPEDRRKLLYFLEGETYRMHLGMRKLVKIGLAESDGAAQSLTEPIRLKPDSEILEKSNAFGPLLCCCRATAQFDRTMEEGYQLLIQLREEKREYGMFNFGDWHGEREVNWGNGEYDFPYSGFVQYLRGAGDKYARLGLLAAEHMEQIDFVRIHPNREVSGLFFLHTPGHSNYYEGKDDTVWDEYFAHVGHLFTQGLAEWYKITGNNRFRDAVLRCADTLCGDYCTGFDFVTEREPAWVMLVMLSAFEISGDQKYINACHIIACRVAYKQNEETGAIKAMLSFGETERKFVFGGKPFMCGILMSALYRYSRCTQNEQAKRVMEKIAHWLVYDMWDDEAKGFWYTDYLKMRDIHCYPANNMEIVEGLLYSYGETGDELLYQRAMEAFLCATGLEYRTGDVGKTFAMRLRFAPATLKLLYGKDSI